MDSQSRAAQISTDPRVQGALQDYFARLDRGEPIDVEAFAAQHPDVAVELRSFIAFDEEARRLAGGAQSGQPAPQPAPARPKAELTTHPVAGPIDRTASGRSKSAGESRAAPAAARSPDDLPEEFGRYRVQKKLGAGAMGAVYLAEDTLLQRRVALKIPTFDDDPEGELLRRFHREARAVANLKHPNLCAVYDVGEIDGRHYISMEFVAGKKLQDFIKPDKPLAEKQAIAVVRKIALAMQEAHTHGVIHRDLKPDNIMVSEKGEPVVMDFGLVHKLEAQNSTRLTQKGTLVGSPAYMSKEQVEGDPDKLTGATDQYSLGVILYQLLTSRLPFEGGLHAVLGAILTKLPPLPREYRPDINPHLEVVCRKMMAKAAEDRYPSMKAAADALAEVAKGTSRAAGVVAVPPATPESLTAGLVGTLSGDVTAPNLGPSSPFDFAAASNFSPSPPVRRSPPQRPKSRLYGSLAAGLAVLLGVVIWIRSGDALVRVEVLSDDVTATFAKETLTLDDGAHEFKVTVGEHRLHIETNGIKFDTDQFTLKRGDNPTLTVQRFAGNVVAKLGEAIIGRRPIPPTNSDSPAAPADKVATGAPPTVPQTPAAGNTDFALFEGTWRVAYRSGYVHHYEIKANGQTHYRELNAPLTLERRNGAVFLDLPFNGMDRFTLVDGKLDVANWHPRERFGQGLPAGDGGTGVRINETGPPNPPSNPADAYQGVQAGDERDDNGLKMKLCWCPPGTFTMGSPFSERDRSNDEAPIDVMLSEGYWLGKYEVTQAQWQQIMGANPSYFSPGGNGKGRIDGLNIDRFPVENVNWNDATAFCQKLTDEEQAAGRLPADWEYRLPTEAQWEYACRAGTTTPFTPGNKLHPQDDANFSASKLERPMEVGSYRANSWGLHDMHGNIWEWCQDRYARELEGGKDPTGSRATTSGAMRCYRGGSWGDSPASCRSAYRNRGAPLYRYDNLGLRVAAVRSPEAPPPVAGPVVGTPDATPAAGLQDDARGIRPGLLAAPFSTQEAHRAQTDWEKWLGRPEHVERNSVGMELVLIPPGKFKMGLSASDTRVASDDAPQVDVTLTEPIYAGRTEVTQGHWKAVMNTSPWKGLKFRVDADSPPNHVCREGGDYPAGFISWDLAQEFCRKLGKKDGNTYRLLTSAEWEYACRAGTTTGQYYGDGLDRQDEFAWFSANTVKIGQKFAHLVGKKKPNAFGLHDMHGNVYEWCEDVYVPRLSAGDNPLATTGGPERVFRGGCWLNGGFWSGQRSRDVPSKQLHFLGFRVAAVPPFINRSASTVAPEPQQVQTAIQIPEQVVENIRALKVHRPRFVAGINGLTAQLDKITAAVKAGDGAAYETSLSSAIEMVKSMLPMEQGSINSREDTLAVLKAIQAGMSDLRELPIHRADHTHEKGLGPELRGLPGVNYGSVETNRPSAAAQNGSSSVTVGFSPQDPSAAFQANTVWVMRAGGTGRLTVLERKDDTFRANFEIGNGIERELSGAVSAGKVSWQAKDVRIIRGERPGADNAGTFARDGNQDRIDFVWKDTDGNSGTFTLHKE